MRFWIRSVRAWDAMRTRVFHTAAEVPDGRGGTFVIAALNYGLAIALLFSGQAICAASATDFSDGLKEATELHEQGDFAHSIPILRVIVKRSPRDYEANLLLGEDLLHSGQPE